MCTPNIEEEIIHIIILLFNFKYYNKESQIVIQLVLKKWQPPSTPHVKKWNRIGVWTIKTYFLSTKYKKEHEKKFMFANRYKKGPPFESQFRGIIKNQPKKSNTHISHFSMVYMLRKLFFKLSNLARKIRRFSGMNYKHWRKIDIAYNI